MAKSGWRGLATLVTGAAICAGQSMSFEVASVKNSVIARDHPRGFRVPSATIHGLTGDRLREPYTTLAELIMQAYDVRDYQISGLSAWGGMMGDQFDIEAKAGTAPTKEQVRLMLQSLLADRFQLKCHRAMKELAVYELSAGRNLRMKDVTGEPAAPGTRPGNSATVRAAMDTFVTMIAIHLDRPIVDGTGLAGKTFEFQFDLVALARCGQGADAVNCVSDLVEANLGLKLSARKSPVDLLVVDRAEKPASN